jgi:hypothetical protein
MNIDVLAERLRSIGWMTSLKNRPSFALPVGLQRRYPNLPPALVDFLSHVASCIDEKETSWFLCESDYDGKSDSAFRWNEWECISLEAATGDPALVSKITSFWDHHFPFILSVGSGYAYRAVCLDRELFGKVVEGAEPEFEEATVIANSFEDFISDMLEFKNHA